MRDFLKNLSLACYLLYILPYDVDSTSKSSEEENSLVLKDGCVVISSSNYAPYVYYNGSDFIGYSVVILDILMKTLGMCYTFVQPPDGLWGSSLPNGSFNGAVGQLQRQEAEIIPSIAMNEQRSKVIDFTNTITFTTASILYPRPGMKTNYLAFLTPFSLQTWMVILATGLLLMATTVLIKKVLHDTYSNEFSGSRPPKGLFSNLHVMWVFIALLNQPIIPSPKGTTIILVLMAFWFSVALIFGMLYRSTLAALLITSKIQIPFNSLEGLVNQKDIKWAFLTGSIIMSTFKLAYEEDHNSIMGKAWKLKSEMYDDVQKISLLITDKNLACIDSTMVLTSIISDDYSKSGECRFSHAKGYLMNSGISIGIRKGSVLKNKLDPFILRLREAGILDRIVFGDQFNASYCNYPYSGNGKTKDHKALTIENFLGTFFFLIGGWIVSIMAFICEVLMKNKMLNEWSLLEK